MLFDPQLNFSFYVSSSYLLENKFKNVSKGNLILKKDLPFSPLLKKKKKVKSKTKSNLLFVKDNLPDLLVILISTILVSGEIHSYDWTPACIVLEDC